MTGYLHFLYQLCPFLFSIMPAKIARSGIINDSFDSALSSLLQPLQLVPVFDTRVEKLSAIRDRFSLGSSAFVIL